MDPGFLTGAGIQVAVGQPPDMLGVAIAGKSTPARLLDVARSLPQVQGTDGAVLARERSGQRDVNLLGSGQVAAGVA